MRTPTLLPVHPLAIMAALLVLLSSLPVRSAEARTAVPRYPREANEDGTFQCYPDGCSPFGLCCSR